MDINKYFIIALSCTGLLFAGCSETKTAQIMKEDQAQLAITLNKGFKTTVIATNTGERIQPCTLARQSDVKQQAAEPDNCKPDEHADNGKVLHEETYKVTVREGSVCITVISGSRKYRFCDPPYDLGF